MVLGERPINRRSQLNAKHASKNNISHRHGRIRGDEGKRFLNNYYHQALNKGVNIGKKWINRDEGWEEKIHYTFIQSFSQAKKGDKLLKGRIE